MTDNIVVAKEPHPWAQVYARRNRDLMMDAILAALHRLEGLPPFRCKHPRILRLPASRYLRPLLAFK